MIESLAGTLRSVGEGQVLLETGGVGFALRVSTATAASLPPPGAAVTLRTRMLMQRDDALRLYGFGSPEEADLFDRIRAVSGVGPGVALKLLSLPAPRLREAIRSRDVKALCVAPGVGERLARRLITELADALPDPEAAAETAAPADPERLRLVAAFQHLQFTDRRRIETLADELMVQMPDADTASRLRVGLGKLTGRS